MEEDEENWWERDESLEFAVMKAVVDVGLAIDKSFCIGEML